MKKFLERVHAGDYIQHISSPLLDEHSRFLWDVAKNQRSTTTSSRLSSPDAFNIEEYLQTSEQLAAAIGSKPLLPSAVANKAKPTMMAQAHYTNLIEYYRSTYTEQRFTSYLEPRAGHKSVSRRIAKFTALKLHEHLYRCAEAASKRGSYMQALFEDKNGEPTAYHGQVSYFFEHNLRVGTESKTHCFAYVRWYDVYYGNQKLQSAGLELWKDQFSKEEKYAILPVQRI